MSDRVLVTGGCGFVGPAVVKQLADAGIEVGVLDDLRRGSVRNLPPELVSHIRVAAIDVRNTRAVARLFAGFRPRVVVHLAAIHFIPLCESEPSEAISVNVAGTQSVLSASATTPSVERIVFASTAAVYAPSDVAHLETSAIGPTDIYGHSKAWSERLLALTHARCDIAVGVARLFNVFGPRETNPHLIPEIIRQAMIGDELRLGNLTTRRDYVYVDDVADAFVRLSQSTHRGIETYNVGNGCAIEGEELVREVGNLLGRDLSVRSDKRLVRASDRPTLLSDAGLARRDLGWMPRTSLVDGLRLAVESPMALGLAPVSNEGESWRRLGVPQEHR